LLRPPAQAQRELAPGLLVPGAGLVIAVEQVGDVRLQRPAGGETPRHARIDGAVAAHAQAVGDVVPACRLGDSGHAEAPVADVAVEVEARAALRATRQPQVVVEVARVQPAELTAQVPFAQRGRAGQLEAADAR